MILGKHYIVITVLGNPLVLNIARLLNSIYRHSKVSLLCNEYLDVLQQGGLMYCDNEMRYINVYLIE